MIHWLPRTGCVKVHQLMLSYTIFRNDLYIRLRWLHYHSPRILRALSINTKKRKNTHTLFNEVTLKPLNGSSKTLVLSKKETVFLWRTFISGTLCPDILCPEETWEQYTKHGTHSSSLVFPPSSPRIFRVCTPTTLISTLTLYSRSCSLLFSSTVIVFNIDIILWLYKFDHLVVVSPYSSYLWNSHFSSRIK